MPGLYVHIPFCASACPYCDFAFVVGRDQVADRYVRALQSELRSRIDTASVDSFDTIYFGGGTPSAVPPDSLAHIIHTVADLASLARDVEITAEANPNDSHKFVLMREAGITRLSLGIQSVDDVTLAALGRTHTGKDAAKAVVDARRAGFRNINVDAIFGGPGQSVSQWRDDLSRILALEPDHISIYGLTIEPRTPFAMQTASGQLTVPGEDDQAAMYDIALDLTDRAGLRQYEISNYARPGYESRHNLSCWQGEPYLGVGMSAHSFDGTTRSWNVSKLNLYLERAESNTSTVEGHEALAAHQRTVERIMLGLRTRDGIDPVLLRDDTRVSRLMSENLIERSEGRLKLTRRGKSLADLVCAELVQDL